MTDNEKLIIQYLRELKPFERLEITASKDGKLDSFLVHRSSKVILSDKDALYCK